MATKSRGAVRRETGDKTVTALQALYAKLDGESAGMENSLAELDQLEQTQPKTPQRPWL